MKAEGILEDDEEEVAAPRKDGGAHLTLLILLCEKPPCHSKLPHDVKGLTRRVCRQGGQDPQAPSQHLLHRPRRRREVYDLGPPDVSHRAGV